MIDALLAPRGLNKLLGFEPIGPPLLWSETISVLHRAVRHGAITEERGRDALDRFLAARVERRSPARLYAETWAVANALGWAKTYDAEYVALARVVGCRLITLDGGLRRAAGEMAEIIGPTQL